MRIRLIRLLSDSVAHDHPYVHPPQEQDQGDWDEFTWQAHHRNPEPPAIGVV